MISFERARRALDRLGITMSNLQLNNFLNELLPNPQCGFSCGGVEVWGDRQSIDKVKNWHHNLDNIPSWRNLVDANHQRAMRAEELGIKLLDLVLRLSAENPAHVGSYRNLAVQMLEDHGIEPREGFFHTQDAALKDARSKFYAAAHPRSTPEGAR